MVQRGSSEYPRLERDHYATPRAPVASLLNVVKFNRRLCDPCCGNGCMMKVFEEFGYKSCGFDIMPWNALPKGDFLNDPFRYNANDTWGAPPDIVTNPPYGTQCRLALKFIERALSITSVWSGKVAMLLPVEFDSGKTRVHVLRDCTAYKHKVVLLDRVKWFNDESGSLNHAWFVWDWTNRNKPTLIYV